MSRNLMIVYWAVRASIIFALPETVLFCVITIRGHAKDRTSVQDTEMNRWSWKDEVEVFNNK